MLAAAPTICLGTPSRSRCALRLLRRTWTNKQTMTSSPATRPCRIARRAQQIAQSCYDSVSFVACHHICTFALVSQPVRWSSHSTLHSARLTAAAISVSTSMTLLSTESTLVPDTLDTQSTDSLLATTMMMMMMMMMAVHHDDNVRMEMKSGRQTAVTHTAAAAAAAATHRELQLSDNVTVCMQCVCVGL